MRGLRVAYALRVFPKLSETFIVGELAELRRRGAEVLILSLERQREELRHATVAAAGLDEATEYDPGRFDEAMARFRPHLVHAHFATEATAVARELGRRHDVPYTFTAHGYDIFRKPPGDFADRVEAASALVTVSEANAEHIVRTFGVPRGKLHVIPCGIDLDVFRPGDDPDPRLIVAVARLNPVKRLDVLLDACALLRDRGVDFRCVVVGEGPCRPELEERHRRLGLGALVELRGAAEQAEVVGWWRRAGVAVLSSEREGMPVCLMEAAASGVPAVAPAVGGIPELVADGETGLLYPALEPAALAEALERVLRDRALAARLGLAARARAEERFSVARQVDDLGRVWAEAIPA